MVRQPQKCQHLQETASLLHDRSQLCGHYYHESPMTKPVDITANGSTFRPRARIMRTLGEELISSDSVAIIELVKNSFDADAENVLIRFVGPLTVGAGEITVIDNGTGMGIETIRNTWLEPATPTKTANRISSAGRRVLGEKGIGRFAASRLAGSTELYSRRRGDALEAHALVDWTQFDDETKYLDQVEIITETNSPREICAGGIFDFMIQAEKGTTTSAHLYHGTVLKLSQLKQKWKTENFEELRRGLSRLISPFSEIRNFSIRVEAPHEFENFSIEIQPPDVVKYPHYTVSGNVDIAGNFALVYTVESTGQRDDYRGKFFHSERNGWVMIEQDRVVDSQKTRQPECGPITVELRIWDRDDLGNVIQISKSTLSNVRKDLDAYAGINVYRDGFRVLPYGEPNNDWLRLDLRRVQNPTLRLSNNQVLGYVAITADGNPNLKDQSNREGLRENVALSDLQEIMLCILARMETTRKQNRSGTSPPQPPGSNNTEKSLFTPPSLSSISEHFNTQHPNDDVGKALIKKAEKDFSRQLEEIKKVVARYQGLATLGQLIDVVLHQGRQPLSKIVNEATLGREDIESASKVSETLLRKLDGRLTKIEMQGSVLHGVFKRVEPFGGRKRGRPTQLYLENVIFDSFEIFSESLTESNVKLDLPKTQTLVRIDPAELQEVIVNLIQNSLYWLNNAPPENRKIVVTVKRPIPEHVEIIFADSGPGIPKEHRERIFMPYFSTRTDGVGLGLSIAGEIISDYYGGTLELLDSNKLGGAAFKITLRKRV